MAEWHQEAATQQWAQELQGVSECAQHVTLPFTQDMNWHAFQAWAGAGTPLAQALRYMWLLSQPVMVGLLANALIWVGSLGSANDLTRAQTGHCVPLSVGALTEA